MRIDFIHIQNFRKLKDCRIEFSDRETIFVGANNSGKTTAMDAMRLFFKHRNGFTTRDFTLSNWKEINLIGEKWLKAKVLKETDLSIGAWESQLPTLDLWLKVAADELHYVSHLIPKLDWEGGIIGIRLRLEPDQTDELYKEFHAARTHSQGISGTGKGKGKKTEDFCLWPKDMWEFLDKKLMTHFKVKSYLLDPDHRSSPQQLTIMDLANDQDVLSGLIRIDIINAQRGFSDIHADTTEGSGNQRLSSQLRDYYDRHLNPSVNPSKEDITALKAIHDTKKIFDENLKSSFEPSLQELADLNYPGFGNARISLSSVVNTIESLNHESSVQYFMEDGISELSLPERYNGLGYQNLISIIFKLMRFRDDWMKVGKSGGDADSDTVFEPLHLVLIEEPEAHLHAQVQQVFIKKAYSVLRKHANLGDNPSFSTQLVISTHSNHIAHEIDFVALRYFKRAVIPGKINTSKVINLSKTFGDTDATTKFAIRYLRTTHCDLFFADAVILVEGPAERMLVPYFIKRHSNLSNCCISILEIGGSHAHRLRPLIESLGIICLVITDIDSMNAAGEKAAPETKLGFTTNNDTLKSWIPQKSQLDQLLKLKGVEKEAAPPLPIKVAYQIPVTVADGKSNVTVYPYTFEDSLVMENRELFKTLTEGKGLLKKMIMASQQADIRLSAQSMFKAITAAGAKKAEFALELLYLKEPQLLQTPRYIEEGLEWLEAQLKVQKSTDAKVVQ